MKEQKYKNNLTARSHINAFSFIVVIFFYFFSPQQALYAQQEPQEELGQKLSGAAENAEDKDSPAQDDGMPKNKNNLPPEKQRTEMEIKTSTLSELALWCRTLGLSEGGTRDDLSRRLREHFDLPQSKTDSTEKSQKIITIESAETTEYFRIEVADEDYARLKGDVRLSLQDKDSVHKIRANEILFNRSRNIITASGNVEYTKVKGDTTEIFRGENITVNIDDWSSIFLAGDSERKLTSEGTSYLFQGTVITRNEEDVMNLRKAEISNANRDQAFWSISASRLWLLPGSDFAIVNALLKVGNIPVLYIPAFYFPADELIFHPVVGYRSREGAFVQTTAYILGRPKVNSAETSSISRILGNSNDMEKERHGLFLRSTGKKKVNPSSVTLKAYLDYYTNMGIYTGADLSTPKTGIINPLELSLGIGFTRTITLINGNYNPYAPDFDGSFDWNYSNLFSASVPFRYRLKTNSSISGKYGNFSWSFPFYSDPYVDREFLNRSESMDWLNMIQQGAAFDGGSASDADIGSYQWQLTGQFTPSLPILAPYVSSISISNISMSLGFKTIQDRQIYNTNREHPGRYFFAPDKYTIYSASGSMSGKPLSLGMQNVTAAAGAKEKAELPDPLKNIGIPRSPWIKEEKEAKTAPNEDNLIPPVLNQRFELPKTGNIRFAIDYQMAPTGSSEMQFMSGYDRWQSHDQVNWSEVQSVLSSFSGNGSLNFRLDHSENFFSNVVGFSGSGTFRGYNYLNEDAEAFRTPQTANGVKDENRIEEAKRQQYRQTNYSTFYSYNGTLRPLYRNSVFSLSSLQYNFRGTLVRSKRFTSGDSPELTPVWGIWAKEESKDGNDIYGLTAHQIAANLSANIMDKQQTLTLSTDLPPLDMVISSNATMRVWISETNANIRLRNNKEAELSEDVWKFDPLNLTETLKIGKNISFTYYMVIDPELDNEITTITSSLTLWDFRASFSAVKSLKYKFQPDSPAYPAQGGRWIQEDGEPSINPRDLKLSYNRSFRNINIIKNWIGLSFNVNSALNFDLQRYTSSNFQLTSGFTTNIKNFLDLTFTSTSENAVIFRYFKNFPGMEDLTYMYAEGDQNNIFIDLFDSFNFGDDSKRRRSGFKMKRFNLTATHYLGDWKATLDVAMSPYLNSLSSPPRYEVNADISFLVQWSAITEIKSDIKYEKRLEKFTIK
ncbi:MAG: LPS-assembly protein LptD [Treponema sp.]|jgi:hypothetical protein|nr:LPS-assembly protein LptD [Treponema sp.]